MKKTVKILALAMAAVMLCLCLASCGGYKYGTYEADLYGFHTTLTFDGHKVTVRYHLELESEEDVDHGDHVHEDGLGGETEEIKVKGKFELGEGTITFIFDEDDVKTDAFVADLNGTHDYEEGDGYIKLDSTKFKKT